MIDDDADADDDCSWRFNWYITQGLQTPEEVIGPQANLVMVFSSNMAF